MLAPINLITGLPGSGKTLRAMQIAKQESENRPVYMIGVEGFCGTWAQTKEPEELAGWKEWGQGATIVVDEAHKWLPQRKKDGVPKWIEDMAETRHEGARFILMTQEPNSLDVWARRRTGHHEHLEAKTETRSMLFEWNRHRDIEDISARQDATKRLWKLPEEHFSEYESATIHERRPARIPWKLAGGVLIFPALGFALWWAYHQITTLGDDSGPSQSVAQSIVPQNISGDRQSNRGERDLDWTDADVREREKERYIIKRTPRFDSHPWSAPIFDETKPDLPSAHACVAAADRCQCYTAQGVRTELPESTCEHIAQHGIHDPYRQTRRESRTNTLSDRREGGGGQASLLPSAPPDRTPYIYTPFTASQVGM